jgi:hypothetical protein
MKKGKLFFIDIDIYFSLLTPFLEKFWSAPATQPTKFGRSNKQVETICCLLYPCPTILDDENYQYCQMQLRYKWG